MSADVPLLKRAMELWKELRNFQMENIVDSASISEESLLNIVGSLMIGSVESDVVAGTLNSIREHDLPHQILSADELRSRYPCFQPSSSEIGVYETDAGYLIPELCIKYYLLLARNSGAELHFGEKFLSWNELDTVNGKIIEVITNLGKYYCKKLVMTVGPWAPEIYGKQISVPLVVERKVLYWMKPLDDNSAFQV